MPEPILAEELFRPGTFRGRTATLTPFEQFIRQVTTFGNLGQADATRVGSLPQFISSLVGEYGADYFFNRSPKDPRFVEPSALGVLRVQEFLRPKYATLGESSAGFLRRAEQIRDHLRDLRERRRQGLPVEGGVYTGEGEFLRGGAALAELARRQDLAEAYGQATRLGAQVFEGAPGEFQAELGGLQKAILAAQSASGTAFGQAGAGAEAGALAAFQARARAALTPILQRAAAAPEYLRSKFVPRPAAEQFRVRKVGR